jgi:hypothetical protein
MGAVVEGVNDEPVFVVNARADNVLAATGPLQSYPLSAAALADQRSRAVRYGAKVVATADLAAPASRAVGMRPRAFDASEGTPLDPLLNTTYDLNFPKVVPSLK